MDCCEVFKDNLLFNVAKAVFSSCKTDFTTVFLEVCCAVGIWHEGCSPNDFSLAEKKNG